MSIAEMIMEGGKQQSQSWSVLSENLGRLGQQVGQQLAMREYQKQAAEALPAMQAAYRSAMDDVSRGSVTEGYKKFMDAQFQFGGSQNPFIAQANEAAGTIFQNASTMYEKQQQRKAQYGGGVMKPTYSLPTDEQLQSGEDFTQDVYQPQGPLPAMRDGMDAYEVDRRTGEPIVNVEAPLPEMEGVDRGTSFGVGAVSGGLDGGEQDFISTDELMIPANPPSKEDTQAILDWRALTPEKQDEVTNKVVVSDVPKGKGKVVSFENIPGVPFAGMVGQNKKNIATIKREYTTEGKGKVTKESGGELNDYDTAAHNATVIGTRISGNKKLMDLFDAAGGNWNKVRISQETDEEGEPVNYAFINGQKFDFPLTSVQIQKDTVPEAFGEVQMIEFVKGLPNLANVNGWKLIEQKAPAAQPAAGAKKLSLEEIARGGAAPAAAPTAQPAAAPAAQAAPVLSEGNPFAKQAKADFETAKTVKAVQEKMATEARRITETREAKKELEKVNQEIARLNEPRKGVSPMMAGLKLSEAKATEKAIEWEKLNTKKKQLERLLSSR